jgi:hypothetical protein
MAKPLSWHDADVSQPSEEKMLNAALEAGIAKIQTSLPGIIVSYDEGTRTAVVQPAVYEGEAPFPVLEDVPVLFTGGAGIAIIHSLVPGDEVEITFSKLDPSRFQSTGVVSQANNVRRAGLYATCRPAALSDLKLVIAQAPTGPGTLSMGSVTGLNNIVIDLTNIKLGGATASDFVALASKVDANAAAAAVWMAAHTHLLGPSVVPGAPTTPPVAPPPTPHINADF